MKTNEERLMMYCWSRGFPWEELIKFAPKFGLQEFPDRVMYRNFCEVETKRMEDFFDGFTEDEITEIGKELFK